MERKIIKCRGSDLSLKEFYHIESIFTESHIGFGNNILKKICKILNFIAEDIVYRNCDYLVIGEDWYICYNVLKNKKIYLAEWYASKNSKEFTRYGEMIDEYKKILLEYRDCLFTGYLYEKTSYRLYLYLLKNNYIEDCYESIITDEFDDCNKIKRMIKTKKYRKNPLHNVEFKLTNKFLEKFDKD